MTETDRRYTDQEVALVLKRAAELEETEPTLPAARGLTLHELHDIAREVGFSSEAITRAVAELQSRRGVGTRSWFGAPPSARVARAVPGRLDESALQRLIQIVEDRVATTGTVTEAVGTIRWTSVPGGHKLQRLTQVAITPAAGETHIQITQRYATPVRTILHAVPASWGAIAGLAIAGSAGVASLPAAGLLLGGLLVGGGIGRGMWHYLARGNEHTARQLADDLAAEAKAISSHGVSGGSTAP
ncbi:MAG TPA: hypothetical protein VGA37_05930 [Gemmatimonadales bacterium]